MTRTETPDEFAGDADFFGREIRGEFARAIVRLRVIQHAEQHVNFPPMQVAVGGPAQLLAIAEEPFDADELAQQAALVATQGTGEEGRAGPHQGGTRRLRPRGAPPGLHELERGRVQRAGLIASDPALDFRAAESAVGAGGRAELPFVAQARVFRVARAILAGGVGQRELVGPAGSREDAGELGAGFRRPGEFIPEPGAQFRRLPAEPGEQSDRGIVGVLGREWKKKMP